MTSRGQNRPPRSPLTKASSVSGLQPDKRRKIGAERMTTRGAGTTARGRQPFAAVTNRPESAASDMGGTDPTESEKIEFTKEGVEALLNEKFKGKKFDSKAKMEHTTDYMRRLKLCLRWFQEVDERNAQEKEQLQGALDLSEGKCREIELSLRNKEEELNSIITELKKRIASLEEKMRTEESEKLNALEHYGKEKESRFAAETLQESLREKLGKAEQEIRDANQRMTSLNDMYNNAREYTTSLQQYNAKLQSDLASANESLTRAGDEKATIVQNLSTIRSHCSTLQEQLTTSRVAQNEAVQQKETLLKEVDCLRVELQQVREERDRHLMKVDALTADMAWFKESTGKSVAELDKLTLKSNALQETCSSQREQICRLHQQLATATEEMKMADLTAIETRTEYEQQKRIIIDLKDRLHEAELKLAEGEHVRKKLHNTILELKGNIRVFCRVRPLLAEDNTTEAPVVCYPTSIEGQDRGIELIKNGQKYPFTFDKVFSHESSQQDVFVEISQLVQSALDGYKVCIFAYGQTGSGKTFTMMGVPDNVEKKGLIPRSLEQIFQTCQSLQAQGWKYKMQASMLEIYNETIRDLLSPDGAVGKNHTITHDKITGTQVSDLTIIDVSSIHEVSSLLRQAARSRSVGKTQMNEQSSRSHMVFTLKISGVNERTEQQVHGVLNLIDLAGSERLSKSEATGDRLKETQAINKSLSSLSDVIFALAKKDKEKSHVPFRNSKLTHLLQASLEGDSKTLMFVNLSPDPTSLGESICSLRFAARVNSCEIGIPRRQTSTQALADSSSSRLSCG